MEWQLLASLAPDERVALLSRTTLRHYRRAETLVSEGDPSDSLHLVEAGRLAVRVSTKDGNTATLNIIGPGDFFGELSLLHDLAPARSASVVALEPARTRSLSASAFAALRLTHRGADQLLLQFIGRRVEELSARLVEVMYEDLDRRMERRLKELAETFADGPTGPVQIPLTQEQLAQIVGGTRPSINEALQTLAERGVVELGRGRITVLDRRALSAD
ncbi:Crp/Fnr family transcriptional regulator [Knoellia sinensis]|nr:Crp/Fnr family transcriptional regulator [Knoellia sinensis]